MQALILCAAFAIASTVALAQSNPPGPPTGQRPGLNDPSAPADATGSVPNAMTRDFLAKAVAIDLFAVEAGKIAAERAEDELVKQVARKMIDDHSDASRKLRDAARAARLSMPAAQLESDQQAALTELQNASGPAFDRGYIAAQQKAHAVAIKMFETYAQSGNAADVVEFAQKALPMLQAHKEAIDKLAESRA